MAPTAKKDLRKEVESSPAPPEPIDTPIIQVQAVDPSDVIVIHPGSLNLRIGRATDALPQCTAHCIAYQSKKSNVSSGGQLWFERSSLVRDEGIIQDGLRQAEDVLLSRPMTSGQYRQPANTQKILEFNSSSTPSMAEIENQEKWTPIKDSRQSCYTGKKALLINPKENYDIMWPMRHGRLNLHPGPGGSLCAVMDAMQDIWTEAIRDILNIPVSSFKEYAVVLLVPDLLERQHIKELTHMILSKMDFASIFVQQESIAACLGSGIASCCVVDIGDQKTSITCVDDGISLTNSRISLDYGGSDITRCFYWLLCNNGFPYKECNLGCMRDCFFLQQLKEEHCTMNPDETGVRECEVQLKAPESQTMNYKMQFGDECLLAPLALFFPGMFGLQQKSLMRVYRGQNMSDPEDPWDDEYVQQTQSKQEQSAKLLAARKKGEKGNQDMDQASQDNSILIDEARPVSSPLPESILDGKGRRADNPSQVALPDKLMGLTDAILYSIDQCDSDEVKKKMYSCIIVTGGGFMFEGAQSWIQNSVWLLMPAQYRGQLETMDVITRPKDLDPTVASWKGAAIMACMDSTQELWVKQSEWNKMNVRILRERLSFLW